MKYLKKVCILKENSLGYSYNGSEIKGLCKLEKFGNNIKVDVSIINLAPLTSGNYYALIGSPEKNTIILISEEGFNGDVKEVSLDLESPVSVTIIADSTNTKCVLYGCAGDFNYSVNYMLNEYLSKKKTIEIETKETDKIINETYFDEILATENYFEKSDVDIKNLKVKEETNSNLTTQLNCKEKENVKNNNDENAFEQNKKEATENKPKNKACENEENKGDCYFECVKEDIENVLSTYPEFEELEKSIYGSKWVKIDLENGEYYFGKTTMYDTNYICYAVKGKKDCCPSELKNISCFVPSSHFTDTDGFFVLFQNERNGSLIK